MRGGGERGMKACKHLILFSYLKKPIKIALLKYSKKEFNNRNLTKKYFNLFIFLKHQHFNTIS